MDFETRAIHEGQEPDPATGAVTVPIYQTSTYAQEGVGVRLVGRAEPRFDKKTGTLEVLGAWGDTSRLAEVLADLGAWLGAASINGEWTSRRAPSTKVRSPTPPRAP